MIVQLPAKIRVAFSLIEKELEVRLQDKTQRRFNINGVRNFNLELPTQNKTISILPPVPIDTLKGVVKLPTSTKDLEWCIFIEFDQTLTIFVSDGGTTMCYHTGTNIAVESSWAKLTDRIAKSNLVTDGLYIDPKALKGELPHLEFYGVNNKPIVLVGNYSPLELSQMKNQVALVDAMRVVQTKYTQYRAPKRRKDLKVPHSNYCDKVNLYSVVPLTANKASEITGTKFDDGKVYLGVRSLGIKDKSIYRQHY